MNEVIGRVATTEKFPATMDKFYFWTDADFRLNAFDVVKVSHIEDSLTFGTVENIFNITDAKSFLTSYISSDFGNTNIIPPTLRIGMNYVEVSVSFNTKNIYTPVKNDSAVSLATAREIEQALGLDKIKNKLPCGFLKMYEGHDANEITLPVNLDAQFILGPEGAHLNISGISGLAAKTSYAMFLMKSVQEKFSDCAFIIFNVKGKDLMAIHKPNDDLSDAKNYRSLNLSGKPFKNVHYYAPRDKDKKVTSYLPPRDVEEYFNETLLKRFVYVYKDDRESLEMLFADIDDTTQTMDSIVSKIIDDNDSDFNDISTWKNFLDKVNELGNKGNASSSKEISVLSWRKFNRIVSKAIKNDNMFVDRPITENYECRLADELKKISTGSVSVIDIAKLASDKQAFVFGDVLKTIYNLKLGEYSNVVPPSKIIIFVDELNKFASKDTAKSSPILRQILDVAERGRSLGIILFGAEQFRSNIHPRVTGNCATLAYGRTNVLETTTKDYSALPTTYKNILTRLEQGEYVIQNPIFRSLLKVKFPKPAYKQFKD
ncbi:MAG: ATP-binding protein [Selenomonadaceae bacterium]|nr:ATP-binding protein [Selenomonadaceae bacterium]